jgi:hypothetical protein
MPYLNAIQSHVSVRWVGSEKLFLLGRQLEWLDMSPDVLRKFRLLCMYPELK